MNQLNEGVTRAEYRAAQFEQLDEYYEEFLPKLQIVTPNGKTKWLDITEEELEEIRKILLK